jgi:hypothetical protein
MSANTATAPSGALPGWTKAVSPPEIMAIYSLVRARAEDPMASRPPAPDYWRVTVAFSAMTAEKATVTAR